MAILKNLQSKSNFVIGASWEKVAKKNPDWNQSLD